MRKIENGLLCLGILPTSRWWTRHVSKRNYATFRDRRNEVIVFTLNPGNLTTRELWKGIMIHRPKIVDTLPTLPTSVSEDLRNWGMNPRFFGDALCYNMHARPKISSKRASFQ